MSHDDSETLPPLPDLGFYYHYKHDPSGEINNYAYEVIGVGYHTEDDCRPIDQYLVWYRPLYDAFVYRLGKGKLGDTRPLSMFMEEVTKEGKTFPRFAKITDPETIAKLTEIRNTMYS
jgi:hypothetical protein